MKTLLKILGLGAFVATLIGGCASSDDPSQADDDEEMSEQDAVATSSSALGRCYCAQPYTCGHSISPSYMYPAAHAAMVAAGVGNGALLQTYGDAPASAGTHCPEPGTHYSAATDITTSSNPCGRVHALRMRGFAAWYRRPPTFSSHIHAVYAGTPALKTSLRNQIASFLSGRNGLVSNAIDNICPITQAEKNAVSNVHNGGSSGGGGGGSCVPGGHYCGGDKVSGDASTLYVCGGGVLRHCAHGCSVNPGTDDSCRCTPGGTYCGGDVVSGDSHTLYRCGSNGVSTTVVAHCANGCRVNPGSDDHCN